MSELVKESKNTRALGGASRDPVAFRFHARALAALGRDLVTNDVVAVMELVKNAYDAMATRVDVRIVKSEDPGNHHSDVRSIEISDNGLGMDHDTIRDVWFMVGTSFRQKQQIQKSGARTRVVTGEKGLGRLSAARLGNLLQITTKTDEGPVLDFSLNWDALFEKENLDQAQIGISELAPEEFPKQHGTRVRIEALRSVWDDKKIENLRENLARLVSPFHKVGDFSLYLHVTGEGENMESIEPPPFMSQPKYSIKGEVDAEGTLHAQYRYQSINGTDQREKKLNESWGKIYESLKRSKEQDISELDQNQPGCGPFQFEIRAWDLTRDDTRDIADHFKESRSHIRSSIAAQHGISVYRDDVLVLPKSEGSRDWLGLDLRRVSRIGTRLSTSQVVGYVQITKSDNPEITDTSDREGLASNQATIAFQHLVKGIIALLENERDQDRRTDKDSETTKELFSNLSAASLVKDLEILQEQGADLSAGVEIVKQFGNELQQSRKAIEKRFGYYNRLAVIGTIAQMVMHEILNSTTVIGRGLRKAIELIERVPDAAAKRALQAAETSVTALEGLAKRFAPLASRGYRPGRRTSTIEEAIGDCVALFEAEIQSGEVSVEAPSDTRTIGGIDPGELGAVLVNLVANSLYWLQRADGERRLRFRLTPDGQRGRVLVSVDDSGPGISPEDRERVFWPGVTRKPDGFGMGLTVASELIDGHGGRMRTVVPGELGGATFEFDLPLVDEKPA